MQEQEIWKDIEGCQGYQVSNVGRIRSCRKKAGEWRMITPAVTKDGYEMVSLRIAVGRAKTFRVHRLVAMAFCEGYRDGLTVNHIDENTRNNRADNLEWVTQGENTVYGTAIERRMKTVVRRMVVQMTMDGEEIARYYGPCDAARATGIRHSGIYAACNGKQTKAGGYRWRWDEKREGDAPQKKAAPKPAEWQPLEGEEWRDVVGYEGSYAVSNLGRVRSLNISVNGGLMRLAKVGNKCLTVLLVKDGRKRGFTIASLVARAFVSGYRDGLWVYHKNGDGSDNRAENLEWTRRTDRRITSALHKPLYKLDANGKPLAEYWSVKEAAESVGITNGKRIAACCNGKRNTAYGFRWRWKQEND